MNNRLTNMEIDILKNISSWKTVHLFLVMDTFVELNKSYHKTIKAIDMMYEKNISLQKAIKILNEE